MSNTKHTPGPWTYYSEVKMKGQATVPTIIQAGKCGHYDRDVCELNFDTNDSELSAEKVLANAKLIAAAPELLEALQELIDMDGLRNFKRAEAIRKGKAAIKKATS